jgi:hypothetical protein
MYVIAAQTDAATGHFNIASGTAVLDLDVHLLGSGETITLKQEGNGQTLNTFDDSTDVTTEDLEYPAGNYILEKSSTAAAVGARIVGSKATVTVKG